MKISAYHKNLGDAVEFVNPMLRYDIVYQSKVFDFTQGLDARLLTTDNIALIKNIKVDMVHFAWDLMKYETVITNGLQLFKHKNDLGFRRMAVYVLTNYNTTHQEDLYRVYTLKSMGFDPFVMIFDKANAPKLTKQMQRWVNNKIIFRSCEQFQDYKYFENKIKEKR